MFEELFQAYQQHLPEEAIEQWVEESWVDPEATPYICPGAQLVDVAFHDLPATTNIPTWLWTNVPYITVFFGSVAFIFVCLWIAIFKCAPTPPSLCCHYSSLIMHPLPIGDLHPCTAARRSCRRCDSLVAK